MDWELRFLANCATDIWWLLVAADVKRSQDISGRNREPLFYLFLLYWSRHNKTESHWECDFATYCSIHHPSSVTRIVKLQLFVLPNFLHRFIWTDYVYKTLCFGNNHVQIHHSRMDDKPVFLRCDSQFIILTVKTSLEQMFCSLSFRRTRFFLSHRMSRRGRTGRDS